ncbi:MAG: T9SS type A sorting domain-containing protein [Actinobacteria bacterium]|nr:T9SS type A sorting domain-containing protein [Actinomycetota bacterium]
MSLAKFSILVFICFFASISFAQKVDSFDDGDFTSSPAWTGNTSEWEIVTDSDVAGGATNSNTLRLNGNSAGGTSYLSTQRTESWGGEQSWSFWMGRRSQAATSSNYSVVWLWANESNLLSTTVDGYRIRFGDNSSDDEIILQRIDDGNDTNILSSSGSVLNGITDMGFMVRVTRTNNSEWTIFTSTLPGTSHDGAVATDIPSKANTPINQGSTVDNTYTDFSNGYFGFMAKYTTSAIARSGAEFDQLYFDTNSDASLPVELASFTALYSGNAVILRWTTESEINNAGFIILRADNEEGPFGEVSSLITAAGTSTEKHNYSYRDERVEKGTSYWYQLKQINTDATFQVYGPQKINVPQVDEKKQGALPTQNQLIGNYPNPFNPGTTLSLAVGGKDVTTMTITVYDLLGHCVRTIIDRSMQPGYYDLSWDGTNDFGLQVPSGAYFCKMYSAGGGVSVLKLLKMN